MMSRFCHFVCRWKIDKDRHTNDALDGKVENNDRNGDTGEIEDAANRRANEDVSDSRGRKEG